MKTVTSKDGTTIAFDQSGSGPAVILVNGALGARSFPVMADLAALLASHFTVINYDRRGRGDSGDTLPYTLEREMEDIEALADEAGGVAFLCGFSSGAALAMEAAIKVGSKVKKRAVYEAPFNSDEAARKAWMAYRKQRTELLAANHRGDAVMPFMLYVGMLPEHVPGVRQHPMWPMFEAAAPTVAYDAAALGEDGRAPIERAARITMPALVMDGAASYPFMHTTPLALAGAMPHGQLRTLKGQTHEVAAEAVAPVLVEFFERK